MKVEPDMVELSLKTYTTRPAMKDAVAETQTIVKDILAVCGQYIRDSQDIKVSTVATNKAYEFNGRTEVFKGYSALQVLSVTLNDIRQLEPFMEKLLATKISSIENIRYNHSKADSIQRVVNLMALSDAKATAEKMCDKMQVKLGKIRYLSNYQQNDQGGRVHNDNNYELNMYNKGFGGRAFMLTTEILEFYNVAFAAFEIEM